MKYFSAKKKEKKGWHKYIKLMRSINLQSSWEDVLGLEAWYCYLYWNSLLLIEVWFFVVKAEV